MMHPSSCADGSLALHIVDVLFQRIVLDKSEFHGDVTEPARVAGFLSVEDLEHLLGSHGADRDQELSDTLFLSFFPPRPMLRFTVYIDARICGPFPFCPSGSSKSNLRDSLQFSSAMDLSN